MLKLADAIYLSCGKYYLCKQKNLMKKILIFVWLVTFSICASASRTPVHLNRCPKDNNTYGNAMQRTSVQPLCIWQEQNCIYVPQGENIYCMLLDADNIIYECMASSQEVVVLPSDVHGQYELLIEVNGVSYKGEISL